MTENEEKKVLLLQVAKELKETSLTISHETADTLYNLINRQKAEIDRLKSENLALSQKRITMVERIDIVNNARNKAIREFADQLKRFICLEEDEGSDFREEMYFKIENLAKEMTEEQNV